ncbi:MAG: phosphoribosyl-AMP cyclohydrolase [Planctomycetota bacterium]
MTQPATGPVFAPRPADKHELEATDAPFAPKFDEHGLIPCITTDAATGEVLMFAFMNDLALAKTIETGMVHYWSRSRGKLWLKGESSGMTQKVVELLTDCDQDVVQARVEVGTSHDGSAAASCHVGYRNCFYRAIPTGQAPTDHGPTMSAVQEPVYDPEKVYGSH